jgi:two-component system sensor histidine kinase CreC
VAAIQGAAELLHEDMTRDERSRFLRNIEAETARLEDIVERLLLLSRVESRKTLDERRPVDMNAIVQRAAASVENQAAPRGISVIVNVPDEPCVVEGDAVLIEKAIANLLQNAVAFTPASGHVAASLRRESAGCAVTITDDGPGIPEYAQARIFERFFSLPRPDTGKKSSGLGLRFVREVAELQRGSITVRNGAQRGAEATFPLPVIET